MKNLTLILCTAAICATWIYTSNVRGGRYESTTKDDGILLMDTKTGKMYITVLNGRTYCFDPIARYTKQKSARSVTYLDDEPSGPWDAYKDQPSYYGFKEVTPKTP